jgi:hypothetical protein
LGEKEMSGKVKFLRREIISVDKARDNGDFTTMVKATVNNDSSITVHSIKSRKPRPKERK